jgi:hypothetical protein
MKDVGFFFFFSLRDLIFFWLRHRAEGILLVSYTVYSSSFLAILDRFLYTQRQARELISGPNLATRARLFSSSRTQSRVVFGLRTGHNTLGRHLRLMGLSNKPTCRKCDWGGNLNPILCTCEALSHTYTYLGSFFFDPEESRKLNTGAIWNLGKGRGLL